jgi:hypothetical protein
LLDADEIGHKAVIINKINEQTRSLKAAPLAAELRHAADAHLSSPKDHVLIVQVAQTLCKKQVFDLHRLATSCEGQAFTSHVSAQGYLSLKGTARVPDGVVETRVPVSLGDYHCPDCNHSVAI